VKLAYISLGTNIEPREVYLNEALSLLSEHKEILIKKESSIYETDPVGYLDQENFLNIVIEINTSLSPTDLLDYCQQIEQKLGRKRMIRYGPRTIDLDILTYEDEVIHSERLIIPHPRMHERAFVLVPFKEIAPDYFLKSMGMTVDELLDQLDGEEIDGVRLYRLEE